MVAKGVSVRYDYLLDDNFFINYIKRMEKKANRFSRDQKILSQAIKGLIDLFYLEELSKPGDSWDWEKIATGLERFLFPLAEDWLERKISQVPESLKESYREKLRIIDIKEKTIYFKDSVFPIGVDDIDKINNIMIILKDNLSKSNYHHFNITGIENTSLTSIDYSSCMDNERTGKFISFRDISKSTMKAINKQTTINSISNDISFTSEGYMIFTIEPLLEFGRYLLLLEPQEELFYQIPSINFLSWTSLISLIRAVLVSFHLSFGSFERLKLCKKCQKMFFEKRKGAREFCSNSCRVMFNAATESEDKRLCRQRQKKYLQYHDSYSFPIYKDACAGCTMPVESGKCQVVLVRTADS